MKDYKPKNTPPLIPYLTVQDAEKALAFYQSAFQFTLADEPARQEGKIVHVEMRLGEAFIMMSPENAWGSTKKSPKTLGIASSLFLYVYVPDVDAYFQHAKQKGAEIISEPADMFWGDRFCQLRDPDGYEWSFATHLGE